MTRDTQALAHDYATRRDADWEAFVSATGPLPDYWARWEERSHGWRVPIEFLQPVGVEAPEVFAALDPLRARLERLPGVEVVPTEWLHVTWVRIGFLMASDVMWSQVETFYVNAAPRLRRVEPFTLTVGALSVADGERVYLGVDDGGAYREARRQAKLGVPKIAEAMRDDPAIGASGEDHFMPVVDIAYLTGEGDRAEIAEALSPFRDVTTGEVAVSHLKLGRVPIQPHRHYESIDIVAEIPMLGAAHRGGYHN